MIKFKKMLRGVYNYMYTMLIAFYMVVAMFSLVYSFCGGDRCSYTQQDLLGEQAKEVRRGPRVYQGNS